MQKLHVCHLAVLVATVALLLHAPPAHADVVALRVKELRSTGGQVYGADSTTCNFDEGGPPTKCSGLCNMTAAGPESCLMGFRTKCLRTTAGDWCLMQVDMEADMNAEPDSSRPARAYIKAHPILRVRRISGPSYSKPSGQPFWKAKWTFEIATAVAGSWQHPAAEFVAQQGSQVRVVAARVYPGCQSMPISQQSVRFNTPTVNCKTGRLEATARVTGCPNFFPDLQNQEQRLEVFNGAISANPYTGTTPFDLSFVYYSVDEESNWRTLSTTGPGAIKAVFERRLPNTWPTGITKIRLGYRFLKEDNEAEPVWDPPQQNEGDAEPYTWRMTGSVPVVPC